MHIPAIALLAVVLSAHLSGLNDGRRPSEDVSAYSLRLGGLAPVAGACVAVALAIMLVGSGWSVHRSDRLRVAANLENSTETDCLERRAALLERASHFAPEDAELRAELGRAYFRIFEKQTAQLTENVQLAVAAGGVLAAQSDWGATLVWISTGASEREAIQPWVDGRTREYLLRALGSYRNARDCCPLLVEPHFMLANHVTRLQRGDSRAAYLGRVKWVAPGDPEAWYLCGLQELSAHDPVVAWASWRRCLELSDLYLTAILEASALTLSPEEIVESVLPDRPELLLAAARRLYPGAGESDQRRPFFDKVLRLLDGPPESLDAEDLHVKAVALRSLGRSAEALTAFERLLFKRPEQTGWRYELAEALHEQARLEDARRELVIVLAQQPQHVQAHELMAVVSHELARQR